MRIAMVPLATTETTPRKFGSEPQAPSDWFAWLRLFADETGSIPRDKFAPIARAISGVVSDFARRASAEPAVAVKALTEGEFFEAVRSIIYKRVTSQVDTHFVDRIHLVGVPDAAAEIAALASPSPSPVVSEEMARALQVTIRTLTAIRELCDKNRIDAILNKVSAAGVDVAIIRAQDALTASLSLAPAGEAGAFDEMLAALKAIVDQLDHEDTGEPGLAARDWIAHWQALHDNAAAAIARAEAIPTGAA